IRERFGGELAGLVAVLQLVERPGRQSYAEGAVMVLPGFAISGPVIGSGRHGEALASLPVRNPTPGQRVMVEAHDADQIRRLLLDDDEPVFFRHLPSTAVTPSRYQAARA